MNTQRNQFLPAVLALALLAIATVALAESIAGLPQARRAAGVTAAAADEAAAKAAFASAYQVFMHPRCMNCHPVGDVPLQGDDQRLHPQNVQRSADGKGKYALKCSNCHQLENVPGLNMPPGAPNWHLPAANMKLVFEGMLAGDLCRQMKSPALNGGKSVAQIVEHLTLDKLVLWGWAPGDGRSKPYMSHPEFVAKMEAWARNGAACPD